MAKKRSKKKASSKKKKASSKRKKASSKRRKAGSKEAGRSATRRTRGLSTESVTESAVADDPIPVASACHTSVGFVLDDILLRQQQGWKFFKYRFGPEADKVHLFFQ